jgi:hypothetical protein
VKAGGDVGKLLRWYPRAWRERYGEEFLAMVEDSLDGGAPTLGLRLSVAWAGLRERGHQARLTTARQVTARGDAVMRWLAFLITGYIFAILPTAFRAPPAVQVWPVTAALDAEVGIAIFGGIAVLASGFLAYPAFVRFLRAGGWPKIRRRVAWAAAVTAAAGGGLTWLALAPGVKTLDQPNTSWTSFLGIAVTALLLAAAFGLWTYAVTATARRLALSSRVRTAEQVLAALVAAAMSGTMSAELIWYSALRSSVWFFSLGLMALTARAVATTLGIKRAVRKGRRRRVLASRKTE